MSWTTNSTLQKIHWWTNFALATFALAQVLEASRAITGELPTASWTQLVSWLVILCVAFLSLALESYRSEKRKGTVLKSNVFFDYLDRVMPFATIINSKEGVH